MEKADREALLSLGKTPHWAFPNLLQLASSLSFLDTVWGSLFWLCGQTQIWCNHNQEDLMLVLVLSTVRLMITIQFCLVSRKVLQIARKRRGRYNIEEPAKPHTGRTEAVLPSTLGWAEVQNLTSLFMSLLFFPNQGPDHKFPELRSYCFCSWQPVRVTMPFSQ